jgi:uncharacterized protein (TIGR03083 family)
MRRWDWRTLPVRVIRHWKDRSSMDRLRHGWDQARYADMAGVEIARFAAAVREVDPSTAVPTCPGWTIAELVKHTGGIHRWVERMVREEAQQRLSPRLLELGLPEDEADYPDWLAGGAEPLVATFRAADPDLPIWAWGADKYARFWPRRMVHETTVHRADGELALGREPSIEAAVAIDGVDEFLDNLPHAAYFAPNVKNLRGAGETLHFQCTDVEAEWLIRLGADGFTWEHATGPATATVRGRAADLLLLVYGRRKPAEDRFERDGDDAVLAFWLANSSI